MKNLNFLKSNPTIFKQFVFGIFIFLSFFSCSKPENKLKTINILENDESEINISEIADDIEYIPLANDSILAYIMKVEYINNNYFVKDNKSKFLRFNEKGELINKIGNRGRGPGEYNHASDFVIDPKTGNIFIIGGKPDQIMVFSAEGKFLKSLNISKKYATSIGIIDDNLFLFYLDGAQHNEENMELLDMEGNIIKSYSNQYKFERGKAVIGFNGECLMYSLDGKLHFKEIFSDTIFFLDGKNRIPKLILNTGDRRFTPEVRTKIIEEISLDPRSTSERWIKSLIQNNLFETSNFLFYSYAYDKKGRFMIYDKSTGNQVEINEKEGIKNDWDGGPNIQLKMNRDDNTLFSWINAFELKAYVELDEFKNSTPKYPEKKKELENLANSLNENDNPVLMLVKLKE